MSRLGTRTYKFKRGWRQENDACMYRLSFSVLGLGWGLGAKFENFGMKRARQGGADLFARGS